MAESGRETRGLVVALTSYLILVVVQFVAYSMTGMLVLLAQALEMLSDVLISGFLLLSAFWSRKPPDEFHAFGHGRAQNVAALVSATILITFMSVETLRESIPGLFHTLDAAESPNTTLALIIILIGMAVVAIPLVDIWRVKSKGASIKAQLIALFKDEAAYIVVLIGVILVARGYYWADAAASTVVGILIAFSGIYLFRDNVHYLVGKTPGNQFIEKVSTAARSVEGVLNIHDLKAEYVGPNIIHAGLHIEIARGTLVEDADRIAHDVEKRVSQETGCQHCIIHVDPVGG
ncbi:MAG: cation diffusion facilitator family transporter [Dehalococcoidales bacterium]|nr:cation diffusion facilitator family transporter [Dehalococcoidales bacterium]